MHFRQHNLIVAALLILLGIISPSQAMFQHYTPRGGYNSSDDGYNGLADDILRCVFNDSDPKQRQRDIVREKELDDKITKARGQQKVFNHGPQYKEKKIEKHRILKRYRGEALKKLNRRSFDRIAIETFGRYHNIKKLFMRDQTEQLQNNFYQNLHKSTVFIASTRSRKNKGLVETFDKRKLKFGKLKLVQRKNFCTDVFSKFEQNGCYCITPLSENSSPGKLMKLIIIMSYNYGDWEGLSAYVAKDNEVHLSTLKKMGYKKKTDNVPFGRTKMVLSSKKLKTLCEDTNLPLEKNCPKKHFFYGKKY